MPVELTLRPAQANSGVVFVRRDLHDSPDIRAHPGAVSASARSTTLSGRDAGGRRVASVSTVEHLLAALHALGIDNVRAELDGPEVPALDGSARGFCALLRSAGVHRQAAARPRFRVERAVSVSDAERRISVEPGAGLRIDCEIDFAHPAIGRQRFELGRVDADVFEREIAGARTFGFMEDVSELRRLGLARGGSLDNTVLLDRAGVMNPEGLRWPDEFARHKALDLIGDLALLGMPIDGRVRVERGGHALHHKLVAALLDDPRSWRVVGEDAGATTNPDLARRAGRLRAPRAASSAPQSS
jgi:UDP-3-O-[3-hydroxymyristoyl] N-acetylglucosamine deacetylase